MTTITELPIFPDRRELSAADKPLFDRLFAALQPRISELTFAGLFLFRQAHAYRVCRVGEAVVVLGQGYDGASYAFPPLATDPTAALTALVTAGIPLYGADTLFAQRWLQHDWVRLVADRDSFDYLYNREELATLPGNRFHKKKNRISYFTRRHDHDVVFYGPQFRSGCEALLADWVRVRQSAGVVTLSLEADACAEALLLSDDLGLQGVVVLVQGRVAAFALGERLNRETAVCHFEKSDPFMEGVGQLVNREFCRLLFTACTYVNREQDLGEPGLREAKLSYHPVALIEKFRVYPKGEQR